MVAISPDNASDRLAALGVEFYETNEDDVPGPVLERVLPSGEREVRVVAEMDPPEPAGQFEGVGAWHVNTQDEAHFLRAGTGQVQFIDDAGIINVDLSAGDVMIIRRAEHRFRALTSCTWVLHYSGPEGSDLGISTTGRPDDSWD